ncbi:MAG: COX15/CtaA family protein [Chloroflexi bacterium]|nr:COX15/CtaA family protein [Chloroflexota bacterium]
MLTRSRFASYVWGVLAYNLLVILWGAFVRATGSGAGCGAHWPLCNGTVIPRAPAVETMIEFTHRLTSGGALLLVVGMLVWAYRAYPRGHIVRRGALLSMIFIITEALLGAGLVLFELVAHNASLTRAFSMAAHLLNTFILIGCIALTGWWASGGERIRLRGQGAVASWLIGGMVGLVLVGMTGAVIALGDTLFFAHTRAGGSEADLAPLVAAIVSIRTMHPAIAIGVGLYVTVAAWYANTMRPANATRRLAIVLTLLYGVQLIAGYINVALQAPVWMQLVHLFLADAVWIALVLLAASALRESTVPAAATTATGQGAPAAS